MITALVLFLVASIFSGLKVRKIKKMAATQAVLETKFDLAQKEKLTLQAEYKLKDDSLKVLKDEKLAIIKEYNSYRIQKQKEIDAYKKTISDLTSIPPDTIYKMLFSMWDPFDQPLKYSFAENQVRGLYQGILDRNHYSNLLGIADKSLSKCDDINLKNDQIINTLTGENANLIKQKKLAEGQITNLQDEAKLSKKLLNRQKVKGWISKGANVAQIVIIGLLVLK